MQFKPTPLDGAPAVSAQQAHTLCYSIMNDDQRKTFEATMELNMAEVQELNSPINTAGPQRERSTAMRSLPCSSFRSGSPQSETSVG